MIGQEDERPWPKFGQANDPGDLRAGDLIAAALRDHFQDLAKAPVPDKFLLLLAELEAKEELSKPEKDMPEAKGGGDAD
jgi:Anti-sigma factor NepR